MSDKPADGAARAFPDPRSIERGAAVGLAIGTLALSATFGLRTAVFLPDYSRAEEELRLLALQGAAELVLALLVGFLVVWLRRPGVAKTVLVAVAVLASLVKSFILGYYIAIAEPPEASLSPGTLLICAWTTLPLWISFLPVLSSIGAARDARALDAPLGVRAAVSAWLAGIGLASMVLGPDTLVRVWSLIALGGAGIAFLAGSAEERRLSAWLRGAVTQGAPVYDVQEGPVVDEVPSVYEGEARAAVISTARQDSASYRRDPTRRPVAAIDPKTSLSPRSFRARVMRRISLLVVPLSAVLCWPFLHGADLPPRRLAWQYNHSKISRNQDHEIAGVTLWSVHETSGRALIVGFDHDRNEVVEGPALFRRVRDLPVDKLAKLANGVLFNGYCCVVTEEDRTPPGDASGARPKPPFVDSGKLVFWRRYDGKVDRFEVEIEPGMAAGGPGEQSPPPAR